MFCGNCGAQIEEGVRFCPKCGAETGGQPAASAQKGKNVQRTLEQEPSAKKKGGRGKKIAVIVTAAVILAGAGGFAGFYMSPQQQYNRAMKKGDACMGEKEYQAAMAFYETALELEDSKEVKKAMAKAYIKCAEDNVQNKAYMEAIEDYLTAQEYDKKNEDIGEGIVSAYLGAGADSLAKADYQTAKQYYENALLIDADSKEAKQGRIDSQAGIGKQALLSADEETARSCFEEVLEYDTTHPTACSGMARLMAMEGKVSEAVAWLDEVMDEIGEDSELLEEKAYLLEHAQIVSKKTMYDGGSYSLEEYQQDGTSVRCSYSKDGKLTREEILDGEGRCLSSKSYLNGSLYTEITWTYDENGNALTQVYEDYQWPDNSERIEYTYTPEGELTIQKTYNLEYGYQKYYYGARYEDGLLRSIRYADIDYDIGNFQPQYRTEYSYDEHREVSEEQSGTYSVEEENWLYLCTTRYQREYDASGRVIFCRADSVEETADYPNQECYTEETYTYDADGNVVGYTQLNQTLDYWGETYRYYDERETSYYADGTKAYEKTVSYDESTYSRYYGIPYVTEYEYNEAGNLVRYSYEDRDGETGVTTYAYDEEGNEISWISEYSDGRTSKMIRDYEYDALGNVVRYAIKNESTYGNNSSVTKYEYSYKLK